MAAAYAGGLVTTSLLTDEQGQALNGIATGFDASAESKGSRFNPESIRVSDQGTWLISSEYAPFIDEL